MKLEVSRLFGAGRNFAAVSTLMEDGSPHTAMMWAGVEGEHLVISCTPKTRTGRNMLRDARVALAVFDRDSPYATARVRGRMIERIDAPRSGEIVDRMSARYLGGPFARRDVTAWVIEVLHEEHASHAYREPTDGD